MAPATGQVFEIVFRNNSGTNPDDPGVVLTVDDAQVGSGILVFEGTEIIVDGKERDRVTVARRWTPDTNSSKPCKIPPGTVGILRCCPSPDSPTSVPTGNFTISVSASLNFEFSYPWETFAAKDIGAWNVEKAGDGMERMDSRGSNGNIECELFKSEAMFTEVLIVGSGPIGATYAREIIDAGHEVVMVEMGAQESEIIGWHKKNTVAYQRDIDGFVYVIKGGLSTLSIPQDQRYLTTASPSSWGYGQPRQVHPWDFTRNGQNPNQNAYDNLGAAAATRCVGGMSTHWTCSTPRQHEDLERSTIFTDEEWDTLYLKAEKYLGTSRKEFESSIRQKLVIDTLKGSLDRLFPDAGREILPLPLACKRNEPPANPDFVTWAATDTILGQTVKKLYLLSDNHCTKVLYDRDDQSIILASVKSLREKKRTYIFAKKYVVCGGSVLTPQLLFNSGFRDEEHSLPALGHYLTEQTMTFCQIILKQSLVDEVWNHAGWKKKCKAHQKKHPEDPLPFPYNDPDPQVTIPVHKDFPWHTQIHRDAFSYGDVPPTFDSRLVVDFRFFGMVEPEVTNYVKFSTDIFDQFHMPQPTFHFIPCTAARDRAQRMMEDMCTLALELGGFLPGSEPQFLEPGLALHICGTTRAGKKKRDSVVDKHSKVWDVKNLWLGGNGVIPTQNACNPTLTSMCFAISGASKLIEELESKS